MANILFLVVFITGGSLLVVEVVATRILSPYFGNTIFTFSSVIGTVLAALSIGYYVGGKLADRRPYHGMFYMIILLSGISTTVLTYLTLAVLPDWAYDLSYTTGPLITAIALFTVPGFLLGMLSPYVIKLLEAASPTEGIGSIAGKTFFWSTLGSIAGTLLAGFVLIPHLGITKILIGVSIVLLAIGVLGVMSTQKKIGRKVMTLLIAIICIAALMMMNTPTLAAHVLFDQDGVYERLVVLDTKYNGQDARILLQDRSTSSAMFLHSDALAFDYTEYINLYHVLTPDVTDALVIGAGAYTVPKHLHRELPNARIDVLDIEEKLLAIAKEFFSYEEHPNVVSYFEDGRRFLRDTDQTYDVIFSDAYASLYSVPSHLTTKEFFEVAQQKLKPDGIFIGNFIGSLERTDPSLILSLMRTFEDAFPQTAYFAVDSPASNSVQNIIFVGINNNAKIDFCTPELTTHPDAFYRNLCEKQFSSDRFALDTQYLLTDDFVPTERLSALLLKESKNDRAFSGDSALALIKQQLSYGPRYPGSKGQKSMHTFLKAELSALGFETHVQPLTQKLPNGDTVSMANVIGRLYPNNPRRMILGTHFDTRPVANLDPDTENQNKPIAGANDGASGVAVLLEAARILAQTGYQGDFGIDIVFFDGEEGYPETRPDFWYPYGSTYFAEHIRDFYPSTLPLRATVLDMVCDSNLSLLREQYSWQSATDDVDRFWSIGKKIAPDVFVDQPGKAILDDHSPLNAIGIPSFLVIDLDYPPFHTTEDTIDKCSSESLSTVGTTLLQYINTLE